MLKLRVSKETEPLGYASSSPSRIPMSLELSVLQMSLLFGTCVNKPLWTSFPRYSIPVLKWGSARTQLIQTIC